MEVSAGTQRACHATQRVCRANRGSLAFAFPSGFLLGARHASAQGRVLPQAGSPFSVQCRQPPPSAHGQGAGPGSRQSVAAGPHQAAGWHTAAGPSAQLPSSSGSRGDRCRHPRSAPQPPWQSLFIPVQNGLPTGGPHSSVLPIPSLPKQVDHRWAGDANIFSFLHFLQLGGFHFTSRSFTPCAG